MKQLEPKCKKYGQFKRLIPINKKKDPYFFNNVGSTYPEIARYYIIKRPNNEKSKQVLKDYQKYIKNMNDNTFRTVEDFLSCIDKLTNKRSKKSSSRKVRRIKPKINKNKKRQSKWMKKLTK